MKCHFLASAIFSAAAKAFGMFSQTQYILHYLVYIPMIAILLWNIEQDMVLTRSNL